MKVAIFALLLIASAFAEVEYATEDGVVVLTDKNFEEAMGSFEFALAEFYAPWCGHCKKLAPEYSAAAQQLAKTNPEIKLVKVDCTVEKDTAAKFEIKGFPTLKFFSKGNAPIAYEGGRTKDEIINWLKKRTGPLSVEVKDVDGAEVIIGNNEVVAFYLGAADTEAHKNFLQAANGFEDLPFAHSHSESVREKYGASSDSIVLFKKFDEKKNVYNGPFDTASIKNFLKTNKDPTVIPFDQKAAQAIFSPSGRDAIFLVRGNNENGAKAEEALRSVANDIKDKVVISVANIEDQLGGRLADYIGINKDALPALRIVQPGKANTKYPFDREITAENIKAFVEDFKNGKLTPFFKSEEIPAQSHEDNVRVLVGKNWKEIVLDETKDVLVEYYAPWCGHCKSLAPTYAAVATRLKDVSDIVVAKMDATANEVEGLSVQGFPTLKFYPRGRKTNPIDYNGERTEEGFIDYFRKNSKASIPERQAPSLDDL